MSAVEVDEYGICHEGVLNEIRVEAGLRIVIAKNNRGWDSDSHAEDMRRAIHNCLETLMDLRVTAYSLQDAIQRIIYTVAEREDEVEYYRLQIGNLLVEVEDKWRDIEYDVDDGMRGLIRENKLFRLESHEHQLLMNRGKDEV